MDLENKVVWITGASSGIGRALALQLAKSRCRLVLSSRSEEALIAVQQQCGLNESNSLIIPFDLKDTSKATQYSDAILSKFGSIDILINNGGFSQRAEAVETEMEITRDLMEVNFFSSVALTKAVAPVMIRQKSGHIVVMSSIAGKFGFFLRSSYSAAKHALHGYFESFRLETEKHGIQTIIVCPGKIKTDISLNAVGPAGSQHNKMDESHVNAMSADECARQIISAMCKNKEEVLIGGSEIRAVAFKRFFPRIFSRLIRKQKPL